jgi:3-phenylpropionate/trans-cinnamate dioxygenase ferredoxin reductase component
MTHRNGDAGTLVIGASQAGLQLAASLRDLGDEAPITLVGEEVHPPYQRPPLSKTFLGGQVPAESLTFRAPDYYQRVGIDLVTGTRVTEVSMANGSGGVAMTDTDRTLRFDRLALAVGARPRRLPLPRAELGGVCYLRGLDDAVQLKAVVDDATDVVVVGGGFIGLELAAAARAMGRTVTVVEAADRLLARAVAPVVSDFYRQAHERRGTTVLTSRTITELRGSGGRVGEAVLDDGNVLPAQVVIVGVGVEPATELAEQLGLECDGGIVVDAACRTAHPAVVAAGDCAVQPNPLTGEGMVRLESVQNAVAQGRTAAATLVGKPADGRTVPWFWSDQDTLKLQIAGLSTGYDQFVLRGDPDTEAFSALYFRDGQLLAVDAVNQPVDYMAVRKALSIGAHIDPVRAADPEVPLKSLIERAPASV